MSELDARVLSARLCISVAVDIARLRLKQLWDFQARNIKSDIILFLIKNLVCIRSHLTLDRKVLKAFSFGLVTVLVSNKKQTQKRNIGQSGCYNYVSLRSGFFFQFLDKVKFLKIDRNSTIGIPYCTESCCSSCIGVWVV
jgi:hypothetical protein